MKKFCKFLFTAASFCLLIGCNSGGGGGSNKLPTPELSLNDAENGLTWEANEHSLGYSITVNGEALDPVLEPGYLFSEEVGTYTVKVVSLADNGYKDSAAATFIYTTAGEPELGDITQDGNVFTCSSFAGARLEYKVGDGEYQTLEGMSVTATENSTYTFKSAYGFNASTKTYYPNPGYEKTKGAVYCKPGILEQILLEDGSEKNNGLLTEKYTPGVEKDSTTTWEPASQAALVLDSENEGFTPSKCIKITVTKQGYAFRIKTGFSADGSYDTISFANKMSSTTETFNLNFEITKSFVVGGLDLNGYSFYYKVSEPTTNWSKYTVSLDDPNWYVQGGLVGNQPFSTVKTMLSSFGWTINSVKDILPHVGSFMIRLKAASVDYATTHAWFDDIKLTNEHAVGTTVEPIVEQIKIYENYSLESANFTGKLTAKNNAIHLALNVGGNPVAIDGTIQQTQDGKLNAISTNAPDGFDFNAIFTTNDSGKTLTLESATGSAASALQGLVCHTYTVLEDFESYDDKGIGNDYQHDEEERTGMRGSFYADWYSSNSNYPSKVGNSGWELMQSDTYSDLIKNDGAHGSSQSGKFRFRREGACRFLNWGLYSGEAPAFYASKFSLMLKGSATTGLSVRVRVFSAPQITPANHTSDAVSVPKQIDLVANQDWTEYTIDLDPTVRYYGFTITSINYTGNDSYYFIDNICAYSHVNPFSI